LAFRQFAVNRIFRISAGCDSCYSIKLTRATTCTLQTEREVADSLKTLGPMYDNVWRHILRMSQLR